MPCRAHTSKGVAVASHYHQHSPTNRRHAYTAEAFQFFQEQAVAFGHLLKKYNSSPGTREQVLVVPSILYIVYQSNLSWEERVAAQRTAAYTPVKRHIMEGTSWDERIGK